MAAVLYVLSFPVDPYMGFGLTVKAFTIIVVGGIGNLPGALLAGVFRRGRGAHGPVLEARVGAGAERDRDAADPVVWPRAGEDGMKALHRLPPLLGLGLVAALAGAAVQRQCLP